MWGQWGYLRFIKDHFEETAAMLKWPACKSKNSSSFPILEANLKKKKK